MNNDTTSNAISDHVTVAPPVQLPVLFAASRNALSAHGGYSASTVATPYDDGENSYAFVIIVLSGVVLAAIFFTVYGLLVKSQALVKSSSTT